MNKIEDIKQQFNKINSFIDKNDKNLFKAISDNIFDLTGDKFSEKIDSVVSKDGVLRIGIVGQVKAGKSSFINALLFEGKDILPKASTPMTAALTVIKYSENISAEVEFYSKADWDIVERKVGDYEKAYKKVEEELKKDKNLIQKALITSTEIEQETKKRVGNSIYSSYEVYMMAKESGLDIKAHIGTTKTISKNISSINELVGQLQDYVGVNGKYTPITRNTNLYLNIPTLKGIELIDTPGTNDPIISRGQTTKDFLSRCDSVFLLSSSGQFMGKEDAEFLVKTLPSEGISNIILLGSKFDSVLIDEFKKYKGNIGLAIKDLYTKLSRQADDSLNKIIASNPNKPIMQKIRNKKVKFISGISYNIAKKNKTNLDAMETLALKNLEKKYDLKFSNEILFDLANIDVIRDKDLEDIKSDKDKILSDKLDDFIIGQKEQVSKGLLGLKVDIQKRLDELESSDIEDLTKEAQILEKGFEEAQDRIKQIFKDFILDVKETINRLISEIDNSRADYTGVQRSTDSRERYSHTSGMLWWKEKHSKTVYYDVANVGEAVDKAVKFIRETNNAIANSWDKMINLEDIEEKLIKEAAKSFDLSDTSFNKSKIINPVKNALRAIKIKPFRLKDKEYIEQITTHFGSSRVVGNEITELESELRNILYSITNKIEETLESKIEEISSLLEEKKDSFVDNIKKDSNETISKLKDDLENKEASRDRDIKLIEEINILQREI